MSDNSRTGLSEAVYRIAAMIAAARGAREGGGRLSPGDVADLRRMDPENPGSAFWTIFFEVVPEAYRRHDGGSLEMRWATLMKGMAIVGKSAAGKTNFGTALFRAGFSSRDRPMRINKLLRAQDEVLDDLFLGAC